MLIKKITNRLLQKKKNFIPPDRDFLFSEAYAKMMSKHLPYPGSYDIHEAQNKTQNFLYRHHEVNHQLCIFRWRGIQKHKDAIISLATQTGRISIDFGGAACPLGFETRVVDYLPVDAFGRKVPFKYLKDVPGQINFLFSSHTLEHITNLEETLKDIKSKMTADGICIFHVPSFYCERWRVGTHSNKAYHDHCWTFGLSGDRIPEDMFVNYIEIDMLIYKYFNIDKCEYCGDDSIYIQTSMKY